MTFQLTQVTSSVQTGPEKAFPAEHTSLSMTKVEKFDEIDDRTEKPSLKCCDLSTSELSKAWTKLTGPPSAQCHKTGKPY